MKPILKCDSCLFPPDPDTAEHLDRCSCGEGVFRWWTRRDGFVNVRAAPWWYVFAVVSMCGLLAEAGLVWVAVSLAGLLGEAGGIV
jgi:hypothetical protein